MTDKDTLSKLTRHADQIMLTNYPSSQVIFRARKERDGYFCNKDVAEQLEQAIEICKENHPNKTPLFVYDNTTTHRKLPDDAPVVGWMTLGPSQHVHGEAKGPSGEKIKVKFASAQLSHGSLQELYYPTNYPKTDLCGAFKGLAKILEERGVPGARKLRLKCPVTKGQKGSGCRPGATDCCAQQVMTNQPDIQAHKTVLELIAEAHG
ncbi:hypothetical protein FRC09_004733, partial [Ceratobasidium sp. 395]